MKNNIFVKTFCTLLIAVVAAFSVSVTSDEPEFLTVERSAEIGTSTTKGSEYESEPVDSNSDTGHTVTGIQTEQTSYEAVIADTVFVTETGTKYHLAGCSYLRSSSYEITLEEAEGQGYTPCSRCFK